MISFDLGKLTIVLWWYGLSGITRRYRWGVVGRRWPTIYLGAFKIITGPATRRA